MRANWVHAKHAKLLAMSLVSPLKPLECLGTPGSSVESETTLKVKMATPTDKCVEHSEKWDGQTSSQISAHPECRHPAPDCAPVRRKMSFALFPMNSDRHTLHQLAVAPRIVDTVC